MQEGRDGDNRATFEVGLLSKDVTDANRVGDVGGFAIPTLLAPMTRKLKQKKTK